MSGVALDLWRSSLLTAAMVATPFLFTALVVGVLTSIFQAATQMQDSMLAFIPKLLAIGLVMLLLGPWVMDYLVRYTQEAMTALVTLSKEQQ
jgi:flagellar biosynthetic protein FliQ